jgi:hypothetical protein
MTTGGQNGGSLDSRVARGPFQRIRRLVLQMLAVGLLADAAALGWLASTGAPLRLHLVLAVSLAVMVSTGLAGLLMGLLFLSNREGIDADAATPDPPRE